MCIPCMLKKDCNGISISTFPPCYAFQMIWPLDWFSLYVAMSVIGINLWNSCGVNTYCHHHCSLFDTMEILMHTNIICQKTQIRMSFLAVQTGGKRVPEFWANNVSASRVCGKKTLMGLWKKRQKILIAIFRLLQRHLLLWECWYQTQITVYNSSPGHPLSHREREVISPYPPPCSSFPFLHSGPALFFCCQPHKTMLPYIIQWRRQKQ